MGLYLSCNLSSAGLGQWGRNWTTPARRHSIARETFLCVARLFIRVSMVLGEQSGGGQSGHRGLLEVHSGIGSVLVWPLDFSVDLKIFLYQERRCENSVQDHIHIYIYTSVYIFIDAYGRGWANNQELDSHSWMPVSATATVGVEIGVRTFAYLWMIWCWGVMGKAIAFIHAMSARRPLDTTVCSLIKHSIKYVVFR